MTTLTQHRLCLCILFAILLLAYFVWPVEVLRLLISVLLFLTIIMACNIRFPSDEEVKKSLYQILIRRDCDMDELFGRTKLQLMYLEKNHLERVVNALIESGHIECDTKDDTTYFMLTKDGRFHLRILNV